ncbi:MAG: CaiB/BaiF CoA-transferase family protein [Solirubrobacterales bacterium]
MNAETPQHAQGAHEAHDPAGPLSHLTVLDFTQFLAGPYATQVLADLGATVIKLESSKGDMTRGVAPHFVGPNSAYFWSLNRGKKSIVIDLKDDRGKDLCLRLVERTDILVENFRPGVMDRLGLGYETLRERNPGLVYCAISGFGQTGPMRERPAYDAIVQAMSGTMSLTGEPDRPPVIIGPPVGDIVAGLYGMIGALAAVGERDRTGHGRYVDVAMFDSQLATLSYHAVYHLVSGIVPVAQGRRHVSLPTYRSYTCADGADVFVTANTEGMWGLLCDVLGLSELKTDPRFVVNADRLEHKEELWALLEERFMTRPAHEWATALMEAGVPASVINTLDRAFAEPQADARDMVVPVVDSLGNRTRTVANPIKLSDHEAAEHTVPQLGEHSAEVLRSVLDMSAEQIEPLIEAGVVSEASASEPEDEG